MCLLAQQLHMNSNTCTMMLFCVWDKWWSDGQMDGRKLLISACFLNFSFDTGSLLRYSYDFNSMCYDAMLCVGWKEEKVGRWSNQKKLDFFMCFLNVLTQELHICSYMKMFIYEFKFDVLWYAVCELKGRKGCGQIMGGTKQLVSVRFLNFSFSNNIHMNSMPCTNTMMGYA